MKLNAVTYLTFAIACIFLALTAAAAQAAPRTLLSAAQARELVGGYGSQWVEWAEGVIREQAIKGNESVTIKGKPCRVFRALEKEGFTLTQFAGKRCHISWREADLDEEKVHDNKLFLNPEEEEPTLDTLTYRMHL